MFKLGLIMADRRVTGALLALFCLAAFPAFAEVRGSMKIGLSTHYVWPTGDADRLDPAADYGVVFHYRLTALTSISAGLEQLSFRAPLKVNGSDKGIQFATTALLAGARFEPKLDLAIRPYAEAGVGYQSWQTHPDPSGMASRSGGGMLYFAGGGLTYDFRHALTASFNLRYLYLPMQEHLEVEAVSKLNGKYRVTSAPFENVGLATAGVELEWRFK